MTKKLLLSMLSFALVANVAMAAFPNATVKGMERNFRPVMEQTDAVKMQKAAKADDTQVFLEDFEESDEIGTPVNWVIYDEYKDEDGNPAMFTIPIYQATSGGADAFSGYYGLASMYDSNNTRDAWAIAPGVELTAGVTYHFGIYSLCQGYNGAIDEWELTIGDAQTIDAQTTVVIDRKGANAVTDLSWTLCQGTFTPETTGTYYPAIHHCTSVKDVNICLWDYFQIDSDHIKIFPEGYLYSTGGLWNLDQFMADADGYALTPSTYIPNNSTLQYGCIGANIESIAWDFGAYGTADDIESATPIVTYALAEEDSVCDDALLIMSNSDGDEYYMRTFNIKKTDSEMGYFDIVGNIKPEDGLFAPSIDEENPYAAVAGLSTFWTRFAECFERPADATTAVYGIAPLYVYYKMSIVNKSKEFTVRILKADENGMPGEAVHSQNYKFSDYFDTNQGGLGIATMSFPEPVYVTGTFFIEMEMPEITPSSSNCFMLPLSTREYHVDNTLYVFNESKKAWSSTYEEFGSHVSMCSGMYVAAEFAEFAGVNKVVTSNYQIYFDGENINVVGAAAGDAIVVTDIAGRTIANTVANDVKTTVNGSFNAGIYLVTINGQTQKIVIR